MEHIEETFSAKLWEYNGKGSWHFMTLPLPLARQIKFFHGGPGPGFGSVRLQAMIGDVAWKTSVFPDSKSGSYLLPVKADIRRKAGIMKGDIVTVAVRVAP